MRRCAQAAACLRSPAHARETGSGDAVSTPSNDRCALNALIATANGACARRPATTARHPTGAQVQTRQSYAFAPAQREAGGADMRAQGPFAAQRLPARRTIRGRARRLSEADGARERAPENACLRRLPCRPQHQHATQQSKP